MGTRPLFERLTVYQLAEELADEIWRVVEKWSGFAKDTVGKQIVRAADSIGANIAEGCGRFTFLEKARFAHIARGSLNEVQHWLRRAYKRSLLDSQQIATLKALTDRLPLLLNGFLRSLRKRKRKPTT